MPTPIDDPIVRKKQEAQKTLLEKAGGDLRKYNEIVHGIAEKARERHPGGFKAVEDRSSLAA